MLTNPLFLADIWSVFAGLGTAALILLLVASLFWIWAIIDCAVNPKLDPMQRIIWLLVIFFLHLLGAIVYVVAGRGNSKRLGFS